MNFILSIAGAFIAVSLVITLLVRVGWLVARRKPARFWKRALLAHAVLIPIYLFVATPMFMAIFVSSRIGTRGDERGYAGPRIAANGDWIVQSRASLRDEAAGTVAVDPALLESARANTVSFETDDHVSIRAFLVAPRTTPRATVVLVHGFFRGGLELEPPASMFRDLGAETLLVEMRAHGGSEKVPFTFGLDERRDVLAAVAWLRRAPERANRPLILYAVSLGTTAVIRAAPDVVGLSGLVVDAPMDDLVATAHRMLSEEERPDRRRLGMWQPFRSLTILAFEVWTGRRFSEVRPIDDLARLNPDMPVLMIGGSEDKRMPPATVQAMFDHLPTKPALKTLWIRPGSTHGQVWNDDPVGYREHLTAFMRIAVP